MHLHLTFEADTPQGQYLAAAARIRGVSRTRLLRVAVNKMLHDQLILAVLDDGEMRRPPAGKRAARQLARQADRLLARKIQTA